MDIEQILADHQKWLVDEATGKRANLRGADLFKADLKGANLEGACLFKRALKHNIANRSHSFTVSD